MRPIVLALLLAGCAHNKNNQTICPESRDLRCMTDTDCSDDKTRGCKVCHCSTPFENANQSGSNDQQRGAQPPVTEDPGD